MAINKVVSAVSIGALLSFGVVAFSTPANANIGDTNCDLSTGAGSSAGIYQLSTEQDLFEMVDCIVDGSNDFELINDIHLNSPWTSFPFSGTGADTAEFEGNNFTISGLSSSSDSDNGMFSSVSNALIQNLKLEVGSISGDNTGSLAGVVGTNTEIFNVHVSATGDIAGTADVGGVVGEAYAGIGDYSIKINNVSFVSSRSVSSTGVLAGGIAGQMYVEQFSGLYVKTNVTGDYAGGIAGSLITDAAGTTDLSFYGTVSGDTAAAGLFGELLSIAPSFQIKNSFVNGEVNTISGEVPGVFLGQRVGSMDLDVRNCFVSAEMKYLLDLNFVVPATVPLVPTKSGSTTSADNVFYDTDKATFFETHSATEKTTQQIKTWSEVNHMGMGIVELDGYPDNADMFDRWVIGSSLNDGFAVLIAALESNIYGEPYKPTSLNLSPTKEGLSFSFNEPAFDGGSAITGYQYSIDDGSNWNNLSTTTTAGVVTGEITGLDSDVVYLVSVRAQNSFGDSDGSVIAISQPAAANSISKTWAETDFTTASDGGQEVTASDTTDNSKNYLEWTLTDAEDQRAGAVWSKSRINFSENFDLTAELYLGDDDSGADGMAFVLQKTSSSALSKGSGIGYGGLTPVLAVEFDTFDNGAGTDEHTISTHDYWSIKRNSDLSMSAARVAGSGVVPTNDVDGDGNAETTAKEFTNPIVGNLEDDQWRKLRLTWNASAEEFNAYFDFNADGDTYDNNERLQLANTGLFGDGSLFGETSVYWGFTASTGSFNNSQKVRFEQGLNISQTLVSNDAPVIAGPANQRYQLGDGSQTLDVQISDDSTVESQWSTSFTNSDSAVATVTGSLVSATSYQFTITPVALGSTTIELSVTDADGLQTTESFDVDIGEPSASFSAPAPFSGPVITSFENSESFEAGEIVTIGGTGLDQISKVMIDDEPVESVSISFGQITFTIPRDTQSGDYRISFESNQGVVELSNLITVVAAEQEATDDSANALNAWTKRLSDTEAKIYAKNPAGQGKVQFFVNGEEIAWVRAEDNNDPKLRVIDSGPMQGTAYLVRTVELLAGKNVLEVYVDGERVRRTAYSR